MQIPNAPARSASLRLLPDPRATGLGWTQTWRRGGGWNPASLKTISASHCPATPTKTARPQSEPRLQILLTSENRSTYKGGTKAMPSKLLKIRYSLFCNLKRSRPEVPRKSPPSALRIQRPISAASLSLPWRSSGSTAAAAELPPDTADQLAASEGRVDRPKADPARGTLSWLSSSPRAISSTCSSRLLSFTCRASSSALTTSISALTNRSSRLINHPVGSSTPRIWPHQNSKAPDPVVPGQVEQVNDRPCEEPHQDTRKEDVPITPDSPFLRPNQGASVR